MILRLKGVRTGKNFTIHGIPSLKINGQPGNITIGDNVFIGGNIDLRNRENGKIIIKDNVRIDCDCRFVVAREGTLTIGESSAIGPRSIFNCGSDVTLGSKCLLGNGIMINSSAHVTKKGVPVSKQGYIHKSIEIGRDTFLGAYVVVNVGVKIGQGAVVGAGAVVNTDLPDDSISAGVPAKILKYRE